MYNTITYSEFVALAKEFILLSNSLNDGWQIFENEKDGMFKLYLKKEAFITVPEGVESELLKAEYIVSFNESYSVPTLGFNIWNSHGMLLDLNDIRKMSLFRINEKEFFSTITQQEHAILLRPYYVVHPCHTNSLLSYIKQKSKNLLITYLSIVSPLVRLPMSLEYALK